MQRGQVRASVWKVRLSSSAQRMGRRGHRGRTDSGAPNNCGSIAEVSAVNCARSQFFRGALAPVLILLGCSADVRIRVIGGLAQGVVFRFVERESERPLSKVSAHFLAVDSDEGLGEWRPVWRVQGSAVVGPEARYGEVPDGMTVPHPAEPLVAGRRYRVYAQGSTGSASVSVGATFLIDERGAARDEPRPAG